MMTRDVDAFTWKLLRMLVRAKGKPLTGRELRHVPSRKTKDGTFLSKLVRMGLLIDLTEVAPHQKLPTLFERMYALTEKGEYAAEHGEAKFTRAELGLPELAARK